MFKRFIVRTIISIIVVVICAALQWQTLGTFALIGGIIWIIAGFFQE